MLHIFLVIVKIIGILLAVFLGGLSILVLCILFWPIRYQISAQKKDHVNVSARVSFIGPVIWFRIRYEKNMGYKLRVFGIPVLSDKKKSCKQRKEKKVSYLDEEEEWDVSDDNGKAEYPPFFKDKNRKQQLLNEETKPVTEKDIPRHFENLWDKCKTKLFSFIESLRNKYRTFVNTIKNIRKTLRKIEDIIEDERVQAGFTTLKSEILLLVKKIKPRKLKWYLKIGFEDPSVTGQVLGALAVLRGIWGQNIEAEPDFENKVFETDFSAKGFVQGFRVLRLGWKCLFDKDIKYLLHKVKN